MAAVDERDDLLRPSVRVAQTDLHFGDKTGTVETIGVRTTNLGVVDRRNGDCTQSTKLPTTFW